MKYKYPLITALLGLSAITAQAQDTGTTDPVTDTPDTTETVEQPTLSGGEQKVLGKIAGDFSEFAGEENSLTLAEALRTGSGLSYEVETQVETEVEKEVPAVDAEGNPVYKTNPDGTPVTDAEGNPVQDTMIITETVVETVIETVNVENNAGPLGMGNVKIAMLLAEQKLMNEGLDGSIQSFSGALFGTDPELADGILEMRADGAGWGEISKELLNTNLGSLMSGKNAAGKGNKPTADTDVASAKAEKGARTVSTGKPEWAGSGKPEKANKTEKPSRPEKAAKPSRPEKPAKPEKPSRPEKPEKPEKPSRPERPEKPAKPEKPSRPNR